MRNLLLLLVVSVLSTAAPATAQTEDVAEKRVLFIGNSLTYYNNLPAMVQSIGRGLGGAIHTELNAAPGRSLADALSDPAVLDSIRTGGWTHVVLQERSSLGKTLLLNGEPRTAVDSSAFEKAAVGLITIIRDAGAEPLLLAAWSRIEPGTGQSNADWEIVADAMVDLNAELASPVRIIPAGAAFASLPAAARPALYTDDGLHPDPEGTYLTALLTASMLYGVSSVEMATKLSGRDVIEIPDPFTPEIPRSIQLGDERTLIDLPSADAQPLQLAADHTLTNWPALAAKFATTEPDLPHIPTLPPGTPFEPSSLEGVWSGQGTHYPKFLPSPVDIKVTFAGKDENLIAAARLDFVPPGSPRPIRTITFESPVEIVDQRIVRFRDPEAMGGSELWYEAVIDGNRMIGIASFEGTATLEGIGSWSATKE